MQKEAKFIVCVCVHARAHVPQAQEYDWIKKIMQNNAYLSEVVWREFLASHV